MQKMLFFIMTNFFICNTQSQLYKGDWLVGGSASFSTQVSKLQAIDANGISINISPDVGYFFIDKFAIGLIPGYDYDKLDFNGGISRSHQYLIGPFLRYYFLKPDNIVNIFSGASYQYAIYSQTGLAESDYSNRFKFFAGIVAFANSSVGLEFNTVYQIFNEPRAASSAKQFSFNIGFQIHLINNEKVH
ncbi:hypothetical protein BH20BAC1_BH20BAC1_03780 [soil metagenome]